MIEKIRNSFVQRNIQWRKHALEHMLERDISRADVFNCVSKGQVVKTYTDTNPYPAFLLAGKDVKGQILHTVIGFDETNEKSFIITVYYPDKK